MNVPFYTSTREYQEHKEAFDQAVQGVMAKGDFILGGEVALFEEEASEYASSRHSIGVANGSDALVIASDVLGYRNKKEVLTPAFTFFASTSCIARLGGTPVFTDVDPDSFCMDMSDAAKRITKNTVGILPVHLFLQMADMTACMKLAEDHKLTVLEDAAEAFGMKQKFKGLYKSAGTIGDFGVYSFFPTKTLGAYGDAGLITVQDDELYAHAKSLRTHGSTLKYHHDYVGYNSRLDTLQAAVLRVKLRHIDTSIQKRKERADQYRALLQGLGDIQLPIVKEGNQEVYYVFTIKTKKRDGLNAYLKEKGIGTSIYYPIPLHLQNCFKDLGYKKGDFPVSEELCQTVLSLPMYPELTEDEVNYTCEAIKDYYKKH